METRIAVLAIVVDAEKGPIEELNRLLSQYGNYIIGRMGIPYRTKGVNIISVAMDGPADAINTLSGKLGRLSGISVKTAYAPAEK